MKSPSPHQPSAQPETDRRSESLRQSGPLVIEVGGCAVLSLQPAERDAWIARMGQQLLAVQEAVDRNERKRPARKAVRHA